AGDGIRYLNVTGVQTCALPISAFTNLIFSQFLDEKVGEMAYDEDARLVYGAKYYPEETPIKAEVLVYESEDSSQESDDEPVNERSEERRVGKKCIGQE